MSSSQYVVFTVGREEYGIKITNIQEIIRIPEKITKLPDIPPFMEGVINLREKVVPVIDLKKRFEMEQRDLKNDGRLLVIKLEEKLIAAIVDEVTEVLNIEELSVDEVRLDFLAKENNCVQGVGRIGDRLVILLDSERLLPEGGIIPEEVGLLSSGMIEQSHL